MGYRGTQNVPFHRYLYESECCPYCPYRLENFHIFNKGLAKNTFTICNVIQSKLHNSTNIGKSFYKRTTLTGVLHRRIRKRGELFLLMRLRSRLARTRKWRQMCYICHTNAHLATCPVQKLNFGQSVRVAKMSWCNDRLTSEQRAFLTFLGKFFLSDSECFYCF